MKDEQRLIEVMAELLAEVHEMRLGIDKSNLRLESVEKQLIMNNKATSELRLSMMKLADRDVVINDHDKRIKKLELLFSKKR